MDFVLFHNNKKNYVYIDYFISFYLKFVMNVFNIMLREDALYRQCFKVQASSFSTFYVFDTLIDTGNTEYIDFIKIMHSEC